MEVLGAVADECEAVRRTVGIFGGGRNGGSGRLLADSARRCGVLRQVTCHSLRHTFATQALENGTDIRTLQQLLGHNDVSTTMIDTHVMNRPGVVARSLLDGLAA